MPRLFSNFYFTLAPFYDPLTQYISTSSVNQDSEQGCHIQVMTAIGDGNCVNFTEWLEQRCAVLVHPVYKRCGTLGCEQLKNYPQSQ